ncbi:MAG: hypothetical protein HY428_00675 [Candidatus Levybacteria bacterium]|nr:hypothetical protein [Candidatus Levybacteria bacterium]
MAEKKYAYGKRSLWQWIVIYLVIGGLIYAVLYYFVLGKKGGYDYNAPSDTTQQTSPYNYDK